MITPKKEIKRIYRFEIAVIMLNNWGYMQHRILSTQNGIYPEFHAMPQ